MSAKKDADSAARGAAKPGTVDTKLEVVVLPVADVGRAKEFYERLGWRLDADRIEGEFRIIQFTPTGSACSVQFGTNLTSAEPGSARALLLTVSDIDAAHNDLVARDVEVSDVFHCSTGSVCRFREAGADDRAPGPAPERGSYGSYVSFSDPDGNGWLMQEVTNRLPGRTDPALTSFGSTPDLASALRRAAAAHGEHEKRIGEADSDPVRAIERVTTDVRSHARRRGLPDNFSERYGPWAVVAGASDGTGASVARLLGDRGINVVLVARRGATLEEVAATIPFETRTLVLT